MTIDTIRFRTFLTIALTVTLVAGCALDDVDTGPTGEDIGTAELAATVFDPEGLPGDYACSFHWFRLPDSRIMGLDVIRSDDTGKLGLRAFVQRPDGSLQSHIHESTAMQWLACDREHVPGGHADGAYENACPAAWLGGGDGCDCMCQAYDPDCGPATTPAIGRGANWIQGHIPAGATAGQSITSLDFSLRVEPEAPALGLAWLSDELGLTEAELQIVNLSARDYLRVHYRGRVRLDGSALAVDSRGPASIHFGRFLPEYAYVTTVPLLDGVARPQLIFAGFGPDNVALDPVLAFLTGFDGVTYGYRETDTFLPAMLSFDPLQGSWFWAWGRVGKQYPMSWWGPSLRLWDVRPATNHQLLGKPVRTATARASLVTWWSETHLGTVVIDFRGTPFINQLP